MVYDETSNSSLNDVVKTAYSFCSLLQVIQISLLLRPGGGEGGGGQSQVIQQRD